MVDGFTPFNSQEPHRRVVGGIPKPNMPRVLANNLWIVLNLSEFSLESARCTSAVQGLCVHTMYSAAILKNEEIHRKWCVNHIPIREGNAGCGEDFEQKKKRSEPIRMPECVAFTSCGFPASPFAPHLLNPYFSTCKSPSA